MTNVVGRRGEDFCRACHSPNLFVGLDLGMSPIANRLQLSLVDEPETFPLCLRICKDCGLGQVGEFETREAIFSDYPYLSSTSESWLDHNRTFAEEMVELLDLTSADLVLELASNDGYLLREFKRLNIGVLGVEPAKNVATLSANTGVETLAEFFGTELASKILQKYGSPRLVVAKNVLAHVPDIVDFVRGIATVCSPSTLVVIETPTISQIIQEGQFDTIYHEHFSYLSIESIERLFSEFGLRVVGVEAVSTHGGSARVFASLQDGLVSLPQGSSETLSNMRAREAAVMAKSEETWAKVQIKVEQALSEFSKWALSSPEIPIVAYGAAAKGVTFLSSARFPENLVSAVIDNSKEKIGKYLPIGKVPIISEEQFALKYRGPVRFLILPWNLAHEIGPRAKRLSPDSSVYVALPVMTKVG